MERSEGRLTRKRALVTGAASGIGRATVKLLAEEGARVCASDLDQHLVAELASELPEAVHGLAADVSKEGDVERLAAGAVRQLGGLDILVNSAGISGIGKAARLADLADDVWRRVIETNLTGTYLVTKAVLPHLVAAGGGAIVNLASTYAIVAGPKLGAYSASKAGIVQLTKNIAIDYAEFGIRANALAPGFVDTPMLRADIAKEADPQAALSGILARIPQRTLMSAEEVARVIVFLASEDARIMTGSFVVADGGYTALGGGS